MSKKFSGVWATFEYLDELTSAIKAVRQKGIEPTVLSPCPRHEIDHALGDRQSRLPFISLCAGALGCLTGYSFTAWTAADWVLPVGGKPIIAIPPFTIIGFELTILFTALFTLMGVVLLATVDTLKNPLPSSVKKYVRFQRDRFGIVIPCESAKLNDFQVLLNNHGAEEVHVENE
ncbi:MAG: DUF3341 domain-containing protein [SAR324 cluster bacterium]|nr:DUF3341 domain-containing protein [SAR324 cluster bacterium]